MKNKIQNWLQGSIFVALFSLLISFGNNAFGGCPTPPAVTGLSITTTDLAAIVTYNGNLTCVDAFYMSLRTVSAAGPLVAGYPAVAAPNGTTFIGGLACNTTYYYSFANREGSGGGATNGPLSSGSFTTAACGTCSDGIQNQREAFVDCGGPCPNCANTLPPFCNPCGATGAEGMTAITPTATGTCYQYEVNNTCGTATTAQYAAACGNNAMGLYYSTGWRTWVKITVPASGTVAITSIPQATGADLPKITLFSNVTCGATNFSAYTLAGCAWLSPGSCNGTDICGVEGTLANASNVSEYGEQFVKTGLTPGTTVYACIDWLGTNVAGTANQICFYSALQAGSNNFIGGAPGICGTTITGTTLTSIQRMSLCGGYKPPSCGGGNVPSFENVSIFTMTSDALGSDITLNIDPTTCQQSVAGVQVLIYEEGNIAGCSGTTPICDVGTCTLGACVTGNTASGMGTKTLTITAPNPNTTYYILIDGFAGAVCNFTIGSTGCVVLPVDLKDFVANREMSTVRLNWKTASEINNDFFIVERSFDGEDFREVEVIDGHGNSSVMKDYELVDYVGEYNGTVYYRLKQFDFDGQETYSVVRTAEFSNLEHNLQIMPNPSNGVCEIKYEAKAIDVSSKIVVYDTKGQVVYEFKRDNVYGINIVNLDLSIFNKGVYIVKVEKESGTVMNKLIKE